MSSEFGVSVITPVYNAGRFLRRCVDAALSQAETGEVILIEDDSPDDSLAVCQTLANQYSKVRLLRHPDGKNHGAGASRNLGIKAARFDFIAFADADNFYLPGRFEKDREILLTRPDVDGVYNAEGIHYDSEAAKARFFEAGFEYQEFLTLTAPVPPEELIYVWLSAHPTVSGQFGTDSVTVRKRVFDRVGTFRESLRLQQDIHLFIRLAAVCRLAPGVLDRAVCVRGVHDAQRMTDTIMQAQYSKERWDDLRIWFRQHVEDEKIRSVFENKYWFFRASCERGPRSLPALLRLGLTNKARAWMEPYGHFDIAWMDAFPGCPLFLRCLAAKRRLLRMLLDTRPN